LSPRLPWRRDCTIIEATDESIVATVDPAVRAEFTTSSMPAAIY
jgi:hypothetical protein